MAKFIYRMQSILDIKYKLEEQAKQQYMEASSRLEEGKQQLLALEQRKDSYIFQYRELVSTRLDVAEIESCKNAIELMDSYIVDQVQVVKNLEADLERASKALNKAIQERKVHEKLKENKFEDFKMELNQEEMKEIDQLVSYQFNDASERKGE